jgi:hypothetical protein
MRYVTSIERLAIERGMQQGMQHEARAILERQMHKRFETLSDETLTRLKSATLEQLNRWADRILDAPTIAFVFGEH